MSALNLIAGLFGYRLVPVVTVQRRIDGRLVRLPRSEWPRRWLFVRAA